MPFPTRSSLQRAAQALLEGRDELMCAARTFDGNQITRHIDDCAEAIIEAAKLLGLECKWPEDPEDAQAAHEAAIARRVAEDRSFVEVQS